MHYRSGMSTVHLTGGCHSVTSPTLLRSSEECRRIRLFSSLLPSVIWATHHRHHLTVEPESCRQPLVPPLRLCPRRLQGGYRPPDPHWVIPPSPAPPLPAPLPCSRQPQVPASSVAVLQLGSVARPTFGVLPDGAVPPHCTPRRPLNPTLMSWVSSSASPAPGASPPLRAR